jgi:hypothetical protein
MKKSVSVLAFSLVLFLQPFVYGQLDDDYVDFNVILEAVTTITVTTGNVQNVYFNDPNDYNVGVIEDPGTFDGIDPGTSTIEIESTTDWDLTIDAADFNGGAAGFIPISNLGVWCAEAGVPAQYNFGDEVLCGYIDFATALPVTTGEQDLITFNPAGPGNSGSADNNTYILHWQMGNTSWNVTNGTMFEQMTAPTPTFTVPGTFTSRAYLTLYNP